MIDLAPQNPYSHRLASPVIVAGGCAIRELDLRGLGAVLTHPTSAHSRHLPPPRHATVPAGLVLSHRQTISARILLRDDARRWARSPVPVWANLVGTTDELLEMLDRLDGIEGLAGYVVEIEGASLGRATAGLRRRTLLPLLVALPGVPTIATVAAETVAAGADALVVALPPPGAALVDGKLLEGQVYGPAVVPSVLGWLGSVRTVVDVPLVAWGGICDLALAQTYLQAGATAVMVDAALWGDPFAPRRMVDGLS